MKNEFKKVAMILLVLTLTITISYSGLQRIFYITDISTGKIYCSPSCPSNCDDQVACTTAHTNNDFTGTATICPTSSINIVARVRDDSENTWIKILRGGFVEYVEDCPSGGTHYVLYKPPSPVDGLWDAEGGKCGTGENIGFSSITVNYYECCSNSDCATRIAAGEIGASKTKCKIHGHTPAGYMDLVEQFTGDIISTCHRCMDWEGDHNKMTTAKTTCDFQTKSEKCNYKTGWMAPTPDPGLFNSDAKGQYFKVHIPSDYAGVECEITWRKPKESSFTLYASSVKGGDPASGYDCSFSSSGSECKMVHLAPGDYYAYVTVAGTISFTCDNYQVEVDVTCKETACDNGVDDDYDTLIDGLDPDCFHFNEYQNIDFSCYDCPPISGKITLFAETSDGSVSVTKTETPQGGQAVLANNNECPKSIKELDRLIGGSSFITGAAVEGALCYDQYGNTHDCALASIKKYSEMKVVSLPLKFSFAMQNVGAYPPALKNCRGEDEDGCTTGENKDRCEWISAECKPIRYFRTPTCSYRSSDGSFELTEKGDLQSFNNRRREDDDDDCDYAYRTDCGFCEDTTKIGFYTYNEKVALGYNYQFEMSYDYDMIASLYSDRDRMPLLVGRPTI